MNEFLIGKNDFLLNGEPFNVYAGAMHYFRVPREYWRDRLLKIKACGFNTVETYTCWNLHEPEEGVFDFSGNLDLKAYLELINELGMFAIVRP
ncbi:MAG: beta-galactosidase, partial [Clostridia bacterium]|nr:beta-galactosidase [Clostridia bacterium]